MQELWLINVIWKLVSYLLHNRVIMKKKLKITQIRSIIDRPKDQKLTIEALGLGRPNYTKMHNDTPQIRGMVNKVSHLVTIEEIEE